MGERSSTVLREAEELRAHDDFDREQCQGLLFLSFVLVWGSLCVGRLVHLLAT